MCAGHVEMAVDRRHEELLLWRLGEEAVSAVDECGCVLGLLVCTHSAELLDVLGEGVYAAVVLEDRDEPAECAQRASE